MDNLETLENELLKILSKDFEGVKLIKVNLTPDVDFDGDEILRVEVVFDGAPKDLNPGLLTRAIRSVRPKLADFDMFAFPSMSFVSAKDAKLASCS